MKYELVAGFETHVELQTNTKILSLVGMLSLKLTLKRKPLLKKL